MRQIKRCPFCGGGNLCIASIPNEWYVRCIACCRHGPKCENKEQAIEAWNHWPIRTSNWQKRGIPLTDSLAVNGRYFTMEGEDDRRGNRT